MANKTQIEALSRMIDQLTDEVLHHLDEAGWMLVKKQRPSDGVTVVRYDQVIEINAVTSGVALTLEGARLVWEKLGAIIEEMEEAIAQARAAPRPARTSRGGIGYGIAYPRPGLADEAAPDGHPADAVGEGAAGDLGIQQPGDPG